MASRNAVRAIVSLPVVILALVILAVRGLSPETMLVLVVLWVVGVVLPRAWEFRNVLLYAALVVLVGAEYLILKGSPYGFPRRW